MKTRWTLALATIGVLLSEYLPVVYSQGLMGGLKGHNRGSGAVELLLATGILAKLLNFRNKHGGHVGRHLLHALIGPRYHGQHHSRYPLELQQVAGHPLLQDDLLEHHASMSSLALSDADLMLNQESALLASKAPLLMSPSMLTDSSALLAEAQLGQQLLAARKARKILEAKKFLAAQEASSLLAAQSEAAHYLAAHDPFHTHALLADQSKQVYTSLPAPKSLPQRRPNSAPQQIAFPSGPGHASAGFVGSNMPPQYQGMQGQQNSGSQTIFPSHQNNFHGNSGLQSNSAPQNNYQSNSTPQGGYQSNSLPQGGYQSNSLPQGGYQGNSGPQGVHNNQGPSDSVMAGSESSPHYHSMPYRPHYGHQGHYRGNSGQGMSSYMSPDEARHFQAAVSRADDVLTIPSDFDDEDAAQIIASLHS